MITTMGLSDNPYAWDVQSVVTMDDLFVLLKVVPLLLQQSCNTKDVMAYETK